VGQAGAVGQDLVDRQREGGARAPRYVRQIFAARQSTVSRYVRERRLEHARADLVHPALATHGVAAIGRHWGFHDASAFSRAFKAQYGQPPEAYRRMNSRV
jgi:AraC-like DNA-binding protein